MYRDSIGVIVLFNRSFLNTSKMMSVVEEAKTADTKQETKMDTAEESISKEADKSNSYIEAAVTEATSIFASETTHPKVEITKDVETTVSVNVKDKRDTVAQQHPEEDLDSSSTQLETSMEVDKSAEADTNVQSEIIKCIPESQETCESMETSHVKVKEEFEEDSAKPEETKVLIEEQPKSSAQNDEEKEESAILMEETKTAEPPPPPLPPPLPSSEISTEDKKHQKENVDDWEVFASDDEEGKTSKSSSRTGVFEPPAGVIIELFERLDKEGVLELEWKCPGRKPLKEDKKEKTPELEVQLEEKPAEEEQKEEEEPTAFDFDVPDPVAKVTPRRAPGSAQAQGSGKKRVARMDKVLNDIMRHKNIDDKDFEFGDDDNEMDTTPQRKHNKFHIRRDLNA